MTNKRNPTELPAWIYENIQAVADWMKQNDYHDWQVAGIGPLADLIKSAQMLAVERGEFRIRAEKAEAELALLQRDRVRLDWVEANGCDNFVGPNTHHEGERRWFDTVTDGSNYSDTIRAAIDAAMREQGANT